MNNIYYNPNTEQLKIAFLAPTGFGKSTACEIIGEMYQSINIKLAAPLYDIQNYYYKIIGSNISSCGQDGELLQFLGGKIQRDYPSFLSDTFFKRLKEYSLDSRIRVITNDDCRPHNYKALKEMGFLFIGINGFSRIRNDLSIVDPNNDVEWTGIIPVDYSVDNMFGIIEYGNNLKELMEGLYGFNK